MSADVFFTDMRTKQGLSLLDKVDKLFTAAGFEKLIKPNDLVALKLHFGERGNTSFIRPQFIRRVVDKVTACSGRPFLTDANTFYTGGRSNAVEHLHTAIENGFAYSVTGAPLIIADGLNGNDYEEVEVNLKNFKSVKIAGAAYSADAMLVITHFKGHELAGFGGAIKNAGMGLGSKGGKIEITLDNDPDTFQEKIVEYMSGVLQNKKGKAGFITFVLDVTPDSDCSGWSDAPIVGNVGILASLDPVALDQACVDLVNKQRPLGNTRLDGYVNVADKFGGVHPMVDWSIQLRYAEEIGLGCREYNLIKV